MPHKILITLQAVAQFRSALSNSELQICTEGLLHGVLYWRWESLDSLVKFPKAFKSPSYSPLKDQNRSEMIGAREIMDLCLECR